MNMSENNTEQKTLLGNLDTVHTNLAAAFYLIFGIIGILGNVSITYILLSSRAYRRQFSCLFLVNLAIADTLVCVTATPYYVVSLLMKTDIPADHDPLSSEHNPICKLPMFFNYFTGSLRILSLTLMSIDRYIAINHPYFYARRCAYEIGKIWGLTSIIYVWVQSLITIIPPMVNDRLMAIVFFGSNGRMCGIIWSKSDSIFFSAIMLSNFALPAILIVFTNCKVFWLARKHVVREKIKKQCLQKSYRLTSTVRSSKSADKENNNRIKKDSKFSIQVSKSKDEESPSTSEWKGMMNDSQLYEGIPITDQNKKRESQAVTERDDKRCSVKSEATGTSILPLENPPRELGEDTVDAGARSTKYQPHKTSSEWEIALSTLALVIFYFASYLPFMTTRLLAAASSEISIEVVAYTTLFTTLGSAMNPLIVFKTRREFRRILKEKLCGCRNIVHTFKEADSSSNGVDIP